MAVAYPCFFGAWDPINDQFTNWAGMQKFSAAPLKSASMYVGWNTPYSYFGAFNDLCAANGAVMYLNLEPWNAYGGGSTPTMQQIGSGAGDAWFTQLATDLKNAGHPVYMCFAHEMNGSWYPWGSSNISASQWVTTWKHVYTVMKNIMGSLLTGVWCPNNNDVGSVTPYWPGASYVDLAAADMYINNTGQTFSSFNQSTVTEIQSLTSGPIWNAETGITLGTYSVTSWVNDMANAGLWGFTQWNEGSFTLSSGNIASMCSAVNAWNNAAPTGHGVVTSTGSLSHNPCTFNGATSGNNNPGGSQTLTVTAVGSDQVGAPAGVAKSVTSFSPVAGSMVRVCATWLMYTNTQGITFSCQDNLGNVYAVTAQEGDAYGAAYSLIFDFQYSSAPGAITLVITASSQNVADCLIQPYKITGQNTSQAGAAVSKANASGSSSTVEISMRNSQSGSYMFVVGTPAPGSTATPVSGTTTDAEWNDTVSGDHGIIGHSTSATGAPGSLTLGWTQSPASQFGYSIAAAEVIPAPNNSGSPSGSLTVTVGTADQVVTSGGKAISVTSFSPTAGSLARVCATWLNAVDTLGYTFTCQDSQGTSYTATLAGRDSDGGCYMLIFDHVYASAPGAITVTITCSSSPTADCLIEPYIITGQAASYSGATNSVNGNTSITTCEINLTTTVTGSRVWVLGAPNNANNPVPTAISGTTTDSEWNDNNVGSHGVIGHSTNATGTPGTTTYGWTLSTASVFGFGAIAAEVLPAGAVTSGLVHNPPLMSGTGAVTGGTTFTASGTVGSANANGFSLAPHSNNTGDFLLLGVWSQTAADWATAISGTNMTWTVLVAHTSFTNQSGVETVFIGQPSSTSSATQTITFNTGSPSIRVAWQEFNASAGYSHVTLDASGTVDTASNGHYPSVTPTRAGDLYWSFCFDSGTVANGNTANCVYQSDANGNGMVYCLSAPNAALQPNTGNTDGLSGIGVMLYQNVVNVAGAMVHNPPLMAASGTVSIVNASSTGSIAFAPRTYAAPTVTVSSTFPTNPLNIKAEILINGTWIDISNFVYQRNDITIDRGLPNEAQDATPSSMTLTLNNRDGRFSVSNPNGAYYPYLTRNTQFRISIINQASLPFAIATSPLNDQAGAIVTDQAGATIYDQSSVTPGTTSNGLYTGYRYWGEMADIPPTWDNTRRDVFVQATINGPMRRFVQGAKLGSTLRQYYHGLEGTSKAPYAAWPLEDGTLTGAMSGLYCTIPPMTFTGSPGFSGYAGFGGSDPIATIQSSVWHGTTGAVANPPGTGTISNIFPGTYTWVCPPGVTAVTNVTSTGSGGGGGDTDGTKGGSGGGGGGTQLVSSINVTAGKSYTYIVAAGGNAGNTGPGAAGSASSFTGDSVSSVGNGGQGGAYAGGPGGTGGIGAGFNGGTGAVGQSSSSANFSNTVYGNAGANGGGTDATMGSNSQSWTAPATVTTATVTSQAAGGGGSAGRGNTGSVGGGGGGGGGARATGTINVTPGHTYSPYAGNGGNGGTGSPGGGFPGPTNSHGDIGGNSGMVGDGGTSIIAGGGGGGGSTLPGQAGNVVAGGGFSGGIGGTGTHQVHGGGASGGGPASDTANGTAGANGDGDAGGVNGVGGDGGTVGNAGLNGTEYGQSGAGGGGGGCNATLNGDGFYGPSGGGGAGGWTKWSWTVTGAPIGGGGGGAAGTAGNGSNGSTSGTGGSSPIGGTGGSAGSSPSGTAPGGGGAGATPANSTAGNTATNPGSGGPGSVSFSWSGGTTSPVAADIIRFALFVNGAGAADGAVLLRALTYGTVARVDVVYHTGGKLELIGYNASSVQIFDSQSASFGTDGNPLYMSLELTSDGANVDWSLRSIVPGGTTIASSLSGSVTGSVGNVSDIYVDPNGTVTDNGTALGWITVQTYADDLTTLGSIVSGYNGELAATRLSRLCTDVGIGFSLVGNATDTPQMGPQQDDTFLNLLQSCADMDRGQLYETRDAFGIGYRTRKNLQGQPPKVIAYYAQNVLASPPQPVSDDQLIRNRVTIVRNGGSSATAQLNTGVMSVLAPPNGVGIYSYSKTVQAFSDSQLTNMTFWVLDVGTVSEHRFPKIVFDMARKGLSDAQLFSIIPTLDIGDYLQIPDPPTFLQTSPISQLCWGFNEVFNSYKWIITVNAVPESPYAMANPPSW